MIQYAIQIPDEVAVSGLYQDAASKFGWVADENADDLTNLQDAIRHCFEQITIPYLVKFAAEARTARQVATVEQENRSYFATVGDTWQAANVTLPTEGE